MAAASKDRSKVLGYLAALIGVALTATYPAMTRPSFVGTLTGADLFALRVCISAMLFAPYLVWKAREVPRKLWLAGVPLSFVQGWGMAALVIGGLQFAPASHASSLGPGTLSASVALIGFLIYGIRVERYQFFGMGVIVGGVLLILLSSGSYGAAIEQVLIGDAMFIAASVFGAVYLLAVQQYKISPMLCAAIVSVYSAVVVLPWYIFVASSQLGSASAFEIGIQVVVQGVLRGGVCFVAVNFAVSTIGSQKTSTLYALLPALGLISSISIADDPASWMDWTAVAMITGGVLGGIVLAEKKSRPPAPMESAEPTRA